MLGDGTTSAEEDRKVLLKWGRNKGKGIALCESGTAEIALRTGLKPQAVAVYELATSGQRVRQGIGEFGIIALSKEESPSLKMT